MATASVHLTDRILPDAPFRQCRCSLPTSWDCCWRARPRCSASTSFERSTLPCRAC